jgi:hypothetical protein
MEEVRAKIRKNFPAKHKVRDGTLRWDRESASAIVSECGTYRISRHEDRKLDVTSYFVWLAPTPTSGPEKIAGPFTRPKDARDAAQAYQNGEPMQQDLTAVKA